MARVLLVDRGIANNYGTHIEINRRLKDYPKLYDYVLKHEKGHKKSFDLFYEFKMNILIFSLILFVLKNPSTWIDLIPIQKRGKDLVYDINLIILYGIAIILIAILVFII